jgi:ATP-dependent phosphoenolpyruvate carboxykinase
MFIVHRWATSLAERFSPDETDAALVAAGWTVEQSTDGRRVSLAVVGRYTAARRARVARGEGDALDATIAGMASPTAEAFTAGAPR